MQRKLKVGAEKFNNVAKLFWLYFCTSKKKSKSQARTDPKSPAQLTTLIAYIKLIHLRNNEKGLLHPETKH